MLLLPISPEKYVTNRLTLDKRKPTDAEPAGKLLAMRLNLGIVELGLYGNASKKASKRAGAHFMKLNEKSRLKCLDDLLFL